MGFKLMPAPIFADISGLIKAYDVLSSLFNYDTETFIAQLKGCLLDCFDWKSNYCAVHWCSLVRWCSTTIMRFKKNLTQEKSYACLPYSPILLLKACKDVDQYDAYGGCDQINILICWNAWINTELRWLSG